MSLRINTTDAGHTAECRALLDSLDDGTFVSLGVLFGTDLCALGGTGHPTCREALKSAWHQLDQKKREQAFPNWPDTQLASRPGRLVSSARVRRMPQEQRSQPPPHPAPEETAGG